MKVKLKKKHKKGSFLRTTEWKNLREKVLERDCNTCFLCQNVSVEDLVVHHILYRKGYSELKAEENNLISVCKKCHWKIHRMNLGFNLLLKLQKERASVYDWLVQHLKD